MIVIKLSGAAAGAAELGTAAGAEATGAGGGAEAYTGVELTVILSSFCLMVTLPSLSSILISPILLLLTTLIRS